MKFFSLLEHELNEGPHEAREWELGSIISGGIKAKLGSFQKIEDDAILLSNEGFPDSIQSQSITPIETLTLLISGCSSCGKGWRRVQYWGKAWKLGNRPGKTHGPQMHSNPSCGVEGRNVKTSCWSWLL